MPLYGQTLGGQVVSEPVSGGGNGGCLKRDCEHLTEGILYPGDPKREQPIDWGKEFKRTRRPR